MAAPIVMGATAALGRQAGILARLELATRAAVMFEIQHAAFDGDVEATNRAAGGETSTPADERLRRDVPEPRAAHRVGVPAVGRVRRP